MTGNPWYRVLTPRPDARQRLIIVPHAGGGPAYYREWTNYLPDSVEIAVVQLPGRAMRWKELPFTRMEPLLAALEPELRSLLDRPTFVFGHSLGALIGFELARIWINKGIEIQGLVVSGAAAPRLPRTKRLLTQLSDVQLRTELHHLGGTPAEVQANDELFHLFAPTLRADLEVLETYRFESWKPITVPILICGGTCDGWASVDELSPWQEVAASSCAIRLFPGGHFFFADQRQSLLHELTAFLNNPLLNETHPVIPLPTADNVDLFHWDLDRDRWFDDKIIQSVSSEELARGNRFIKPEHRRRFLVGRARLRSTLSRYSTVHPDIGHSKLQITTHGKPFLSPVGNPDDLRFNLSHSEAMALLAIARGHDVGCDIERFRPAMAAADMARRYLSAREVADLEALSKSEQPHRFFAYWAAKESYIKARGLGLHIPLDQFDVPFDNGPGPFVVVDRHTPSESGKWHVYPLNVSEIHAAAVCVERRIRCIRLFNWPDLDPITDYAGLADYYSNAEIQQITHHP